MPSWVNVVDDIDTAYAAHMNNAWAEIIAIATELGLDVAEDYTDLKTRLNATLGEAGNAETTTATGNITLADSNAKIQYINCNGADRDVTMPAEAATNHEFVIVNTSGADYVLTVKDDGGGTLCIIDQNETGALFSNGSAWYALTGVNIAANIDMNAGFLKPAQTNPCDDAAAEEFGTNDVDTYYLAFDSSTLEAAQASFTMPDDYNGGAVIAQFVWGSSSTGTVTWGIKLLGIGDSGANDQAWGTLVEVSDSVDTADDKAISAWTAAVTPGGSPAAGSRMHVYVQRDPADGSDDLAVDAKLEAVRLRYIRKRAL